jgi:hypothetical protein
MTVPTDPQQLAKALVHVNYEIDMMTFCFGALHQKPTHHQRNAYLEALTIHVRALLNFLLSDGKKDDMLASHFVSDNAAYKRDLGELSPALKDLRGRINKHVAHITYTRETIAPEERLWDTHAIFSELAQLVQVFRKHTRSDILLAPPSHLSVLSGDSTTTLTLLPAIGNIGTGMVNPDPNGENKF